MTKLAERLTPYVLTSAILALTAAGCVSGKVTVQALPEIEKYRVKTIVILPFETLSTPQRTDTPSTEFFVPWSAKRSEMSVAVPPATERLDRPTTAVPSYAAEKVTRMFYGRLRNWQGIRVLSTDETAQAVKALGTEASGVPLEQRARQVAVRLGADAALVGRILVYQEREGSKLGANPAATVGFEVKLLTPDGTTLWVGNYYEKQRPFNEDFLGSVQRGFVFVTAEELAEYGAERLVQSFPFGGPAK